MTDLTAILQLSGWSPDRRVDISLDLEALRSDGYTIWPQLEEFLKGWSGLDVKANGVIVELGAVEAAAVTEPAYRQIYERHAGCSLAPIGIYSNMTIMLGDDGLFYGSFDDLFGRLAADLPTVIEQIVTGRPGKPLQLLPEIAIEDARENRPRETPPGSR